MPLSIKNEEADRLARELAERTGETITEAVVLALRERLLRVCGQGRSVGLAERLMAISRRARTLPVLDDRSPDEILYDERGAPK